MFSGFILPGRHHGPPKALVSPSLQGWNKGEVEAVLAGHQATPRVVDVAVISCVNREKAGHLFTAARAQSPLRPATGVGMQTGSSISHKNAGTEKQFTVKTAPAAGLDRAKFFSYTRQVLRIQ